MHLRRNAVVMNKPIYKVIDSRGRITLPKSLRSDVDIQTGDVIELLSENNSVRIIKAEVIHIDNTSQISLKNTAIAALKEMDEKSLIEVSKKAVSLLEKKKGCK